MDYMMPIILCGGMIALGVVSFVIMFIADFIYFVSHGRHREF